MNSFDIVSALEYNARTFPDKPAFIEPEGRSFSWSETRDAAMSVASALASAGRRRDLPVAVTVGRDASCVAAILGCIAAGRWYVPIDGELPPERMKMMIGVADPELIVSSLPGASAHGLPVIDPSSLPAAGNYLPSPASGDEPLFGIFTSGSTGTPKLVVKSSRAMTSFIAEFIGEFGFSPNEVFGNQIPFFFDASTKDLFATVALGAACVIIPQKEFSFPVNLVSILNKYKVTSVVWVPSALSIAARFNVFSAALPETLANILFVGEQMPVKYLNVWMNALPGAEFVNLYGSTEVAGNSCFYRVPRGLPDDAILPVGRPFNGIRVFLAGPDGTDADEGEIAVAGPWLANGYWRDPEKTASVFRDC
ncbi:MAG: AMP-binding protein, partial [Clostridia bacterium]|nr:AMP-binding protein [Clostridia bacterium]